VGVVQVAPEKKYNVTYCSLSLERYFLFAFVQLDDAILFIGRTSRQDKLTLFFLPCTIFM